MNSPFFRVAVLASMAGMGWWYWTDMQGREEVRKEEARVQAENQKSAIGEKVHGTQERLEQSSEQYDKRTQDLQKAVEE